MKASELRERYQKGERNFQGVSFKNENLSKADFTGTDIRGADFTEANLEGAKFCRVTCGLREWQANILVTLSCCLAVISGIGLLLSAAFCLLILQSNLNYQIVGLAGLILLFFDVIIFIPKEISGVTAKILELIPKVKIKRQIDEPSSELKNRKSLPHCSQHGFHNLC